MAPRKKDTVDVIVRLPRAVADELERAAGKQSTSDYIAGLVTEHLESLRPDPPTARSSG